MKGLDPLWRPGPAYVLAPHIEVTSEVAALEAGQHTWWVAIKVTGRLSPILSGEANPGDEERSESCMRPHAPEQRAFPTFRDATNVSGGVSSVQSRVDTVATASGVDRAKAAIKQMGNHGCAPRVMSKVNSQAWPQLDVVDDAHEIAMPVTSAHTAPAVPLRHASLQRDTGVREPSVAMRSINEMRQVTPRTATASSRSSSARTAHVLPGRGQSACVTGLRIPEPPPTDVGRQSHPPSHTEHQRASPSSGLWKKRSLGAETLRGLLPARADLSMAARDQETSTSGPVREGPAAPAKVRKDAGRWGWGAWF
ncbi:hypothetical protein G7Z17_g11873 [Cylindrodendrum hubeiense]|uniref:Uncharacterized protein n=1 Tax=Cylindrodendrum hubeiense TaxID=595255 RepID=A0A9P5L9T9_9HYPO|nr:hypothetical protein G7Z17_g11873 [Cylindrodendrum hubeiense]